PPPLPRGAPLRARLARVLTLGGERRPLLLFATVLMGVAVILSRSRMGIAAMLAALLGMSAILAWWSGREERAAHGAPHWSASRRGRSRIPWAAVVPMALLLGIVVYSAGTDISPTIERFFQVRDDLEAATGRPALWAETLPVVRDFLWTGAGAGAYVFALNPHLEKLPGRNFWYYDHAHNDYLEAVATLGLAGVVLAAAALALFCARRPRSLTALAALVGLATLAVHSVVDFLLAIPSNALLACALLCLSAGRRSADERAAVPAAAPAPVTHPWRASAIAFCLIALTFGPGRALAAAVAFRPYWNASPDRAVVAQALQTAARIDPWNDTYPRKLAESEIELARERPAAPLLLGDDLERQIRRRQVALLGGFVSAQAHILESIDRNPLDFEAHADLAAVASTTRGVLREIGLFDPTAPLSPALLAAPHLTSVALAPTTYANHASMGWMLWKERAALGEAGTARALELLRQGLADRTAPQSWYDAILQTADDAATLASIEAAVHPPSAAYARLLRQSSVATSSDFFYCAAAFQALAAVREAQATLHEITTRTTPLDDDARALLARVRDTLLGAQRAAKRLTLTGADAPACSATASPAALA
ncbi:MAG TPA: O-antigen ligase family protein, partial [Candidatus Dormibacteraeota bacterium]|nr:O-antigen ligase family protein [Candidatus Dormibacteraeota bacterium]